MAQISAFAPVKGADLQDLREKLGLTVSDFCWLFGLSMPKWSKINKEIDQPLRDPSIAILARWFDRHPDDCPIKYSVDISQAFDLLNLKEGSGVTKKELGVALGREASAGYRWLTQGGRMPPILERILSVMTTRLEKGKPKSGLDVSTIKTVFGQLRADERKMISKVALDDIEDRLLAEAVSDTRNDPWAELCELAEMEARARGINDIFRLGNWQKPRETKPVKAAGAKARKSPRKAA